MKSVSMMILALALLATGAAHADEAAPTGILCAWGVAGFGSDPSEILGIYQVQIPFKSGTRELSATGKGFTDKEETVKIAAKPAADGQLYAYDIDRGSPDINFQVTVSKAPFTGKFAGLSPELKKEAVTSTAKMAGQDLPGFCVIK